MAAPGERRLRAAGGALGRRWAASPVQTGAGVILGVICYALLINYIRGGTAQVGGWALAKLVNKPYAGAQVTA